MAPLANSTQLLLLADGPFFFWKSLSRTELLYFYAARDVLCQTPVLPEHLMIFNDLSDKNVGVCNVRALTKVEL